MGTSRLEDYGVSDKERRGDALATDLKLPVLANLGHAGPVLVVHCLREEGFDLASARARHVARMLQRKRAPCDVVYRGFRRSPKPRHGTALDPRTRGARPSPRPSEAYAVNQAFTCSGLLPDTACVKMDPPSASQPLAFIKPHARFHLVSLIQLFKSKADLTLPPAEWLEAMKIGIASYVHTKASHSTLTPLVMENSLRLHTIAF